MVHFYCKIMVWLTILVTMFVISFSQKMQKMYRKIKSEAQRVYRRVHDKYVNYMFSAHSSNKQMWSYINKNRTMSRRNFGPERRTKHPH